MGPAEPEPGRRAPTPLSTGFRVGPAVSVLCLPSRSAGSPRRCTEEAGMVSVSLQQLGETPGHPQGRALVRSPWVTSHHKAVSAAPPSPGRR